MNEKELIAGLFGQDAELFPATVLEIREKDFSVQVEKRLDRVDLACYTSPVSES
jgi:hypothetical protein